VRKKYPTYKDSGVNWIDEIPSTWSSGKMKYKLLKNDGGTWGRDTKINEDGIIVIRSTEIEIDGNWNLSNPMKRSLNKDEINKCLLYEGDIVITKSSGSSNHIGKSVVVSKEIEKLACCFSNFVQRIRFRNFYPRLYHYILNSYVVREQYRYLTQTTTGLGNLNSSTLDEVQIPFIPISEQKQILKYLDHKIQMIDKLIDKTKKKIELLKEKRTALINHYVTKGLNSDVDMKDSGIDWIGKIPNHWNISKIKYIKSSNKYAVVDGPFGSHLKTEHYIENGDVYVIDSGFITSGKFKYIRNFNTISKSHFEKIKRSECVEGNIIIAKIGEYYGMCGILPKLDKKSVVSGNSISLKVSEKNNTKFVHQFILQHRMNGTFKKKVQQTGQPFISLGIINNLIIVIPPIYEQNKIVKYIEEQTKKIDSIIEKENKGIELLNEYRKSLISEVVTGKIDVRDEVVA
jgi:type I restriction enzyme, S subunit